MVGLSGQGQLPGTVEVLKQRALEKYKEAHRLEKESRSALLEAKSLSIQAYRLEKGVTT